MKTTLLRCLMLATLVSTSVLASAQEKEDTLCIGEIYVRGLEPVKSIFKTENDSCIDKLIVVNDDNIFGEDKEYPKGNYPVRWVLTETKDRTILHCYVKMTVSFLKDFYLGGIDKASIADLETGRIYEARGSYDPQVWNRAFNVSAPIGTVLDFPIEFPPLPKDIKMVFVYGVPLCNLNGVGDAHNGINIRDNNFGGYDEVPHLNLPRLIKEESANYDADDWDTWAAYDNIHTVRPCKDGLMALWRTPEKTYITVAYEQNWRTEYFCFDNFMFADREHPEKVYEVKKIQGLPDGHHLFMSHAEPGSWVCFTLEFEPLPLSAQNLYLAYNPEGKPGEIDNNEFYVNTLRSNQKYFEYYKPDVTTLDASPMAIETTKAEYKYLKSMFYMFKLIDSKTKKAITNAKGRMLGKNDDAVFEMDSNGFMTVPQYISQQAAIIFAEGYEPALLSLSKYKPGKEYTIRMNRLPNAGKEK